MEVKELWLLNTTSSDVLLGDLNVKVPTGKTVNLFAANPYLTDEQVSKSKVNGSLFKRLQNKVLKVVAGNNKKRPASLDKILESKEPVMAKRTKTSVVIEPTEVAAVEGKGFEFADYGLGDLESSEVNREQGSVIVKAKQDAVPKEVADTETVPTADSNLSKQSTVVMDTQKKNMSNPIGKLANSMVANQPFVVTKPPVEIKEEPAFKAELPKITKAGTTVLVGQELQVRDLKAVVAEQKGEEVEPKIQMVKLEIDARVATKTKDGAIIMEMKEVPAAVKPKKGKKVKPTS